MEGDNQDGLTPEEQAAAGSGGEENSDVQHQIDRGDFLPDGDGAQEGEGTGAAGAGDEAGKGAGEDAAAGKGEGEVKDPLKQDGAGAGGDTDLEALAAVAGEVEDEDGAGQQVPAGMPFARANEISREKNAALDLGAALIDGRVDKRWITDMGGQQAVVKGIAAGKIVLPAPPAYGTNETQAPVVHPEVAKLEAKLDELNEKFAAATVDVNLAELRKVQKEINAVNREILKVENAITRQAEAEQARREAAKQDEANVQTVMVDLWDKHPELHSDTNEYLAFMARRDSLLKQGKPMSQALKLAAEQTFKQDAGDGGNGGAKTPQQIASERLTQAREKGAKAKAAQPPSGQGVGFRATEGQKSIEKLSDDEFDKLTPDEKARARGDII